MLYFLDFFFDFFLFFFFFLRLCKTGGDAFFVLKFLEIAHFLIDGRADTFGLLKYIFLINNYFFVAKCLKVILEVLLGNIVVVDGSIKLKLLIIISGVVEEIIISGGFSKSISTFRKISLKINL